MHGASGMTRRGPGDAHLQVPPWRPVSAVETFEKNVIDFPSQPQVVAAERAELLEEPRP